jgi:hypothetical protein
MTNKIFIPSRSKMMIPHNKFVGGALAHRKKPIGILNDRVAQNLSQGQRQMSNLSLTNKKPLRLML